MRGMGSSTLRGGQTTFHSLRMWGQLFRAALILAAAMIVAVPAWNVWRNTTGYEWYAAGMFTLAEAKLAIGYRETSLQEVRQENGQVIVTTIRAIASSTGPWLMRERIRDEIFAGAILGGKLGAGIIAAFLAWFWYRGIQMGRRRRVRGAELASVRELRRRVQPLYMRLLQNVSLSARLSSYRIAGIPYPERAETQHTIVSGTTGSGKTVLIADLIEQIRARGERCVIYDKMGSYTRSFFDPGRDVLLNPLDARAPRWSPFLEARNPRDFDMMAAALIPQQKDAVDPFWVTAARQLFSNGASVFWRRGVRENRVLVENLLKTELTDLAAAMEGTVAQSIVDPANPKTALSVRAMLTAHLAALEFLPDTGHPFSIREWIGREEGGGFLFLTSRGDQHASLRGLISTWLEIAINALLSLEQEDGRRVWIVLDELPTLHQVPSLQPGLAESRQFGGCFVLGIQVASALRDLYGRNGAETISGLCGTRVVLAAPDRDTAQWSADSLGRSEVEEISQGVSYGANTGRDGVSLTPHRELRALALPADIMRLPNLAGYLKFPGPYPVAGIKLRYAKRPKAAERFVPREKARGEAPPVVTERAAARSAGQANGTKGAGESPSSSDHGNASSSTEAVEAQRQSPATDADQWKLDLKPAAGAAGRGSAEAPGTASSGDAHSDSDRAATVSPPSGPASGPVGSGNEPEARENGGSSGTLGSAEASDASAPETQGASAAAPADDREDKDGGGDSQEGGRQTFNWA